MFRLLFRSGLYRECTEYCGKSTGPTWSKLVKGACLRRQNTAKRRPTWPSWSKLAFLGPTWSKLVPYTLSHRTPRTPDCNFFVLLSAVFFCGSTPNMTGRRFHRTMEALPVAPGSLEAPLLPDLLEQAQTRGREGRARGTTRCFRHPFPLCGPPGRPVISAPLLWWRLRSFFLFWKVENHP